MTDAHPRQEMASHDDSNRAATSAGVNANLQMTEATAATTDHGSGKRYRLRSTPPYPVYASAEAAAHLADLQAAEPGGPPVPKSLISVLSDVRQRMARGESLADIIKRPPHRPKQPGFTADEHIAAYVGLRLRELGGDARALAQAKKDACRAFVDLEWQDDPARVVRRAWKNAGSTIGSLSSAELEAILTDIQVKTRT